MIDGARHALHLLIAGNVFPSPRAVIARIPERDAVVLPVGFKYSIATVVAHADFWQRYWLSPLIGERVPDIRADWVIPSAGGWKAVREGFLDRFDAILELAARDPFAHRMKSDTAAAGRLLMIAEHNAYHLGQVVLLKRAVRANRRNVEDT